jgi:hypothetical protein
MHAVHISWFERPQGSPIEYENAQKRILEVFGQWKAPANFKIEFFVIRVGEWGGPFPGRPSISDEHTSQTIGYILGDARWEKWEIQARYSNRQSRGQRIWRQVGASILWRLAPRLDGTLADHTRMAFFRCFRLSHRADPTKVLGIGQEADPRIPFSINWASARSGLIRPTLPQGAPRSTSLII